MYNGNRKEKDNVKKIKVTKLPSQVKYIKIRISK